MTPTRRQAGYQSGVMAPPGGRWPLPRAVCVALGVLSALVCACEGRAEYPPPLHPGQPIPEQPPMVIEPQEAALYIGHPDVSFIDARPAKVTRKGHAPGAVSIEWTEFRDAAVLMSGKLDADERRLAAVFGDKGVGSDSWAIIFGDPLTLWGEEGRIAWTLAYLGATRVSIVDGGYSAWVAAGLPVQKGRVERSPRLFVPALQDQLLARKHDVEDFVAERGEDSWRTVLLDVREPGEYRGLEDAPNYGAVRRGHLPTAVNIPWRDLLDEAGRIKPREELGPLLIDHGVRPDARIITYCTGGVRSAHTWFVLHMLGYPNVQNYAGSWWEWSLDRKLPIEQGPERQRAWAPAWPPGSEEPGDDDDSAVLLRAGSSGSRDPAEFLDALKRRLIAKGTEDEEVVPDGNTTGETSVPEPPAAEAGAPPAQ